MFNKIRYFSTRVTYPRLAQATFVALRSCQFRRSFARSVHRTGTYSEWMRITSTCGHLYRGRSDCLYLMYNALWSWHSTGVIFKPSQLCLTKSASRGRDPMQDRWGWGGMSSTGSQYRVCMRWEDDRCIWIGQQLTIGAKTIIDPLRPSSFAIRWMRCRIQLLPSQWWGNGHVMRAWKNPGSCWPQAAIFKCRNRYVLLFLMHLRGYNNPNGSI